MRFDRRLRQDAALCVVALLAALLTTSAHTELVFRVPDVRIRHGSASGQDRPVGTGYTYNTSPVESEPKKTHENPDFEEFFVEHEVSATSAKNSARALNLDDVPDTTAGCGVCTRRDLEYCEIRLLSDHCCCERGYVEPFPWLPHTCYMGREKCLLYARDCAEYARLRVCCCGKRLAEKWKDLLSTSKKLEASCYVIGAATLIATLFYIL